MNTQGRTLLSVLLTILIFAPRPAQAILCQSNLDCTGAQYCEKAPASCFSTGTCQPLPDYCPAIYDPVCGCDGITYPTACDAALNRVNVATLGECSTPCWDMDGDTFTTCDGDCNDDDSSIFPGAAESCDNIDRNCNGDPYDAVVTYYQDSDLDTFGNANSTTISGCTPPAGYVDNPDDCNDNDPDSNPQALEIHGNGLDENCNGLTDDTFPLDLAIDETCGFGGSYNTACSVCSTTGQSSRVQYFTPTYPILAAVELYFTHNNSVASKNYTLEIRETDISGAVLGSAQFSGSLPNNGNSWITFVLSPQVTVTPGSQYAMVLVDDCAATGWMWEISNGCGTTVSGADPCGTEWADKSFIYRTFADDLDGDGYSSINDCNDLDTAINPGATEIPANGIDDDCNPATLDSPDSDGDGIPDIDDPCPQDAQNDVDADGVCGDVDNCPTVANSDQTDSDSDYVGDACDVNSHNMYQLTDNNGTDRYPQVNQSGHIVWMARVDSDYEIFYYDGVTVQQLTDNDYDDKYPQINESNQIIWQGSDGSDYEIFLKSGDVIEQLTVNDRHDGLPQINDAGIIVWEQKITNEDYEIILYQGGVETQITSNSEDDWSPQINNAGLIIWEGYDGTDWEIFKYENQIVTQISVNDFDDLYPVMNTNGLIAWMGEDPVGVEIYTHTQGATAALTVNSDDDVYPQMNDSGHIVWQNFTTGELWYFDGATTFALTDSHHQDALPSLNNHGNIAWLRYDGNTTGVFFYNQANGQISKVAGGTHYNSWPRINDSDTIVWFAPDAAIQEYEIFIAQPVGCTPSSEVCDYYDNNCDGLVDENLESQYYTDADFDGYGDATTMYATCQVQPGLVLNGDDCNDSDSSIHPGAVETCWDGVDNNCDGNIDSTDPASTDHCCDDIDGDGFTPQDFARCTAEFGMTPGDCNDNDGAINPGAVEACWDGVDNNCDGNIDSTDPASTDHCCDDIDGDGFTPQDFSRCTAEFGMTAGDCNDNDGTINPGAVETCWDGVDNNCDGNIDSTDPSSTDHCCDDIDGDGFTPQDFSRCTAEFGMTLGDCNDTDGAINPAALELCSDGIDNNCNGQTDTGDDACTPIASGDPYSYIVDAPHDKAHGVTCSSCHSYSAWWQYSPMNSHPARHSLINSQCLTCHSVGSIHGTAQRHVSPAANSNYGIWDTNCTDCHDPHFQAQLDWIGAEPDSTLYLVRGTLGDTGSFQVNNNATTVAYILTGTAPNWGDPAEWSLKNSAGRGLILVRNSSEALQTFEVIAADQGTITVQGVMGQEAALNTFGLLYGQMLKSSVDTANNGVRPMKFFDARGDLGFVNSEAPPTGVCQVCHTQTLYWQADGSGQTHNSGLNCAQCHSMANGFSK